MHLDELYLAGELDRGRTLSIKLLENLSLAPNACSKIREKILVFRERGCREPVYQVEIMDCIPRGGGNYSIFCKTKDAYTFVIQSRDIGEIILKSSFL